MATEDDNFDIDIYGDGGGYNANDQGPEDEMKHDDTELILDAPEPTQQQQQNGNPNHQGDGSSDGTVKPDSEGGAPHSDPVTQAGSANPQSAAKETPTPQQGTKRKEHDDRPTDPDATPALLISDLYWWTTDDDIRGWVCQADCEDELKDVTFSEHKVNGKSKGQAFLEFTTLQAATATKHKIESFSAGGQTRKHMVTYTSPQPNPFRTLPKDAPMRKDNQARSMSGGFNSPNPNMNFGGGMNNMGGGGGGYRGGRGGYNNRGGMSGGMGGGNFGGNRNFQNPMGGFQGPMVGGGFQGNPMGMQNYGGFNNRGGMMGGMRGGPGGMRGRGGGMAGPNMMGMPGMNPMGGMGMNAMPGAMNPMMGGMAGNMGMQGQGGFQGPNPAFNQGFFPPNQGVGDGSWNPHGAKRSRQE